MTTNKDPFFGITPAPPSRFNTSEESPVGNLSFNIFFTQMNHIFKVGFTRPLELSDLGTLPTFASPKVCYDRWNNQWQKELLLPK